MSETSNVPVNVLKRNALPTPRVTDYPFFLPCLGLVAGYFGTYSAGLLRWRRKLRMALDAD